jgi:hypothetical protein
MATVTYKGPKDKSDGTNRYVIGGVKLRQDVPVEVTDKALLKSISEVQGHNFDIAESKAADKTEEKK